jgi:type IV pilus assembly protein PilC
MQTPVITFTRQLYSLMKAGIPLLKALQINSSQVSDGKLKEELDRIILDIQEGKTFSEALSLSPRYFSLFYVNMIKAAEISGNMVLILSELSTHFIRQRRITRQVQSAFMYPVLVLFMSVAILTMLLLFVVPTFEKIFADLGGSLPPLTQMLIQASRFGAQWWWLILLVLGLLVSAFIVLARYPAGKRVINKVAWRLPLFGSILKLIHLGRFCRMTGTLLSSGITLVKGLEVLQETTTSVLLAQAMEDIRISIEQGESVSSAMEHTGIFPLALVKTIQIGEESGKIAELFLDAAQDYEFLSLLEPLLIITMGVVVGFIVIALFFPILTMSTMIR